MIALYIILGILFVIVIPHCLVVYIIFCIFFGRYSKEQIDARLYKDVNEYTPFLEEMMSVRKELEAKCEKVSTTSHDGLKLTGYYFNNNSDTTMIMFHGVHTNAFNNFGVITKNILEHGYNALIVDQRAHGESEGKYLTYGQKEQLDVLSWIDYVDKNIDCKTIFLYGISMGGTSVALSSNQITNKKVKGMVIDSAYSSLNDLLDYLTNAKHIPSFLFLGGVKWLSKVIIKIKFEECEVSTHISNTTIPAFFVRGTKDTVVSEELLMNNYINCASRKELLSIEGATHTLAMVVGKEEAFNKMYAFLERNI